MRKLLVTVLAAVLSVIALAQEKKLKTVPAPNVDQTDGAEMYKSYCASCHGITGEGNGPAAEALKVAPANLTRLRRNNNGKFPEARVLAVLEGKQDFRAHGSTEMPVWGSVFRVMAQGDRSSPQLRMRNLTRHVESLQR